VPSLRDAASQEPRARRLLWLAIGTVLLLGPFGFNLARASSFEASRLLFPQAVPPYPASYEPGYYQSLLADHELREQVRLKVGDGVPNYDDVNIDRGPAPNTMSLAVEAVTPDKAQQFVNALGPQIAGATRRQVALLAAEDADRVRARLRASPSGDAARVQRRRLARLEELQESQPPRLLLGAEAPLPRLDRWPDRVVDGLPGEFLARRSPVWAALAGLLVAGVLWLMCLTVLPPRSRPAG
jgi:hypothetical protein